MNIKQFKKYIKENGVTKARISEDFEGAKKGQYFGFFVDDDFIFGSTIIDDKPNRFIFTNYKGTFEVEDCCGFKAMGCSCDEVVEEDIIKKNIKDYIEKHYTPKFPVPSELGTKQSWEVETEVKVKYPEIIKLLKKLWKNAYNSALNTSGSDREDWSAIYEQMEAFIKNNFIPKEEVREMLIKLKGKWKPNLAVDSDEELGFKKGIKAEQDLKNKDIEDILNKL